MNTPQNNKKIEEFSDEIGNTFTQTSNIIDFINMQQNNILLNKSTPTPKQ